MISKLPSFRESIKDAAKEDLMVRSNLVVVPGIVLEKDQ